MNETAQREIRLNDKILIGVLLPIFFLTAKRAIQGIVLSNGNRGCGCRYDRAVFVVHMTETRRVWIAQLAEHPPG